MTQLQLPTAVKTYPTLNVAFLRKAPAVGACWYLYRAADLATYGAQGWLAIAAIRELQEPYRTWRSVRQLHTKGHDLGLWAIDGGERLRLFGLAKTAAALGAGRLSGRPVYIPTAALTAGVQLVRAHFFASYDSGRAAEGPLSRTALAKATGVPPSTQRLYDALLGRDERVNVVVTAVPWAPENLQEAAWKHGPNLFPFTDYTGRRGPAGQKYIAYQLPSTRALVHKQAPRGRQKKANATLVTEPARVTGVDFALYHHSVAAAARAARNHPGAAHYLLEGSDAGANIWSLVT